MGCLFGGLLTEAGYDVSLLDVRPEHVEKLQKNGLSISRSSSERKIMVKAFTNPDEIDPAELIIIFVKHADILYGFFALLLVTNLMLLVFGYFAIRYLRRIALIPQGILFPAVTAICFAGSFAVNSSFFDILIMVAGGFVGYLAQNKRFED